MKTLRSNNRVKAAFLLTMVTACAIGVFAAGGYLGFERGYGVGYTIGHAVSSL